MYLSTLPWRNIYTVKEGSNRTFYALYRSQWSVFLSSYFIPQERATVKVFPEYDRKVGCINACRYTFTHSKRLYWVEMREQFHNSTALLQSPSGCFLEGKNFMQLPGIEPHFFGSQDTVPPEISTGFHRSPWYPFQKLNYT